MRAIVFDEFGGPEVLRLADAPLPVVRAGDLLVRVEAIGINRADLNHRRGAYGRADFGDSTLMGLEMAGRVAAMGPAASGFAIGDQVMGIVGGGAYADFVRIDHGMAMRVPDGLDPVGAAAIPEAFVTAHEALVHLASLASGETVLIQGASGGIGTAAVQVAQALGARVIYGARAANEAAMRSLGGAERVDPREGDMLARLGAATNGRGVDVILDCIGAPLFHDHVTALADGGRLVQIGLLGGSDDARLPIDQLMFRRLKLMGSVMKSRTAADKAAMTRRFADRWLSSFTDGRLRPVVACTFPIDEAAEAHRAMEAGGLVGKIVLTT